MERSEIRVRPVPWPEALPLQTGEPVGLPSVDATIIPDFASLHPGYR
jgi:hypothetical protein